MGYPLSIVKIIQELPIINSKDYARVPRYPLKQIIHRLPIIHSKDYTKVTHYP